MPKCPRCGSDVASLREPRSDQFSRREREILGLLLAGLNPQQVGTKLSLTYNNVNSHIHHMLRKTGMHRREDLLTWAHAERVYAAPGEPE
jgi:DNA-binding CsgD family transcriptional regulator